jgi:hypothetical protein
MSLFEQRAEKLQLYLTMDQLNDRYGKKTLTKAAAIAPPSKTEDKN